MINKQTQSLLLYSLQSPGEVIYQINTQQSTELPVVARVIKTYWVPGELIGGTHRTLLFLVKSPGSQEGPDHTGPYRPL